MRWRTRSSARCRRATSSSTSSRRRPTRRFAREVGRAIRESVDEVPSVQTHLEPLGEPEPGRAAPSPGAAGDAEAVGRIVREATGAPPRELRFLQTDDGLVAFLTLGLDPASPLSEAHARASRIEEEIRRERPEIADVIVHTEP